MLTAQRLRELLHYDPETGIFTRLKDSGKRWKIGQSAGRIHKSHGYVTIGLDGGEYFAHRLAWLYMTGDWPTQNIDHNNGIKHQNTWTNLRDVSKSVNSQNQRRSKKGQASGYLGVYRSGNRWRALIHICGEPRYLGTFDTAEIAFETYLKAKREYHEGCTI